MPTTIKSVYRKIKYVTIYEENSTTLHFPNFPEILPVTVGIKNFNFTNLAKRIIDRSLPIFVFSIKGYRIYINEEVSRGNFSFQGKKWNKPTIEEKEFKTYSEALVAAIEKFEEI